MILLSIQEVVKGTIVGRKVTEYTITNKNGLSVSLMEYGAAITSIFTPNKNNAFHNIVLGFDQLADYQNHPHHFGGTIGRVAGRIKQGKFQIHGKNYQLYANENENHLHGGIQGFDRVIWESQAFDEENKVSFYYLSPDGENGYPGNLAVSLNYQLTNENELRIQYSAKTDRSTLFNPTNHVYFNLNDEADSDVTEHILQMKSSQVVETDSELIPTGNLLEIGGTVLDFQSGKPLGTDIIRTKELEKGLDHAFVLKKTHDPQVYLTNSNNGREVMMSSDVDCVVVYTGVMFTEEFAIEGVPLKPFMGVTLEAQHLPDAINHEHIGDIILEPNQEYKRETSYRFHVHQ